MIGSSPHFSIFKVKKLAQISDEESMVEQKWSIHENLFAKNLILIFWAVP